MRAIDLYAGIGGWSLGLKLAGVKVVGSYEWWQPAIDTHNGNHDTSLQATNIRTMDFSTLPDDVDLVVGSPPCTQFSYSNRGGSGNLDDGLIDLERFFAVVDHLRPKFWAMENVPRVAKFLETCFEDPNSPLYKYRHLNPNIQVFDFSEYGCPQARKRCIATNIPLHEIEKYKEKCQKRSLGDVLRALGNQSDDGLVVDPIWGVSLPKVAVTETEQEEALSIEELRINRDSKTYHPVYNNMAFPDKLDVPSRTVTATCTRVSRESIIVENDDNSGFRRLTVRERALLQGFPITYQFYGKSFSEKAKMIGNAIPPTFSYILASFASGQPADDFVSLFEAGSTLKIPASPAKITPVDKAGRSYPAKRRFRAAIPGLRFKSGMRFEFANDVTEPNTTWSIRFYTGNSKAILQHQLIENIEDKLLKFGVTSSIWSVGQPDKLSLERLVGEIDGDELQAIWTRRSIGESPFNWVDRIGHIAEEVQAELSEQLDQRQAEDLVLELFGLPAAKGKPANEAKLKKYAIPIIAGTIVGTWFNNIAKSPKISRAA